MKSSVIGELENSNYVQTKIMQVVCDWGRKEKKAITRIHLLQALNGKEHLPERTFDRAIMELIKKGYLRRAETFSNRTAYVQLRSI